MKDYLLNSLRSFFLVSILLFSIHAFGTNYYFSSTIGDDSRTAMQAQNPATPWETLTKLNLYFIYLNPGDSVLLKRGDVFNGLIIINKSGTADSSIIISSYGSGKKPIINGFTTVAKWINLGNGVYESNNAISILNNCNMVTINDQPYAMGRYPKANAPNKGYLTITSHTGGGIAGSSIVINSSSISSIPSFVSGEVTVRSNKWTIDRGVITSQSSGAFTYTAPSTYTPMDGFGFFFQNHPNTLLPSLNPLFGEWYYNGGNTGTRKLRIFFGVNDPSSYVVKASTVDNLVTALRKSFITIDNISFHGANNDAFNISGGSDFIIQNCEIFYNGYIAVAATSTTNLQVKGCFINYSNNEGIQCKSSNTSVLITNNIIQNTGVFAGMGEKNGNLNGYIAITGGGENSIVQFNRVINTGYIAIQIGHSNTTIQNNLVDTFNLVKNDGGGIYMNDGRPQNYVNRKIIGNIVLNGQGANEGTNSTTTSARGIYLDDNTSNVKILENTVANGNGSGIFLHNAYNIIVKNNIVYNCGTNRSNHAQFSTQHDDERNTITNCIVKNNIFFSRSSSQLVSYILDLVSNDVSSMGTFDSNYYCRPLNENNTIKVGSTYYSLAGWKTKYGKDKHSNITITAITDTNKIRFEYNPSNDPVTINLDKVYVGIDGKIYSGTIQLNPFTSIILIVSDTSNSSIIYYRNTGGDGYGNSFDILMLTIKRLGYVTEGGL